MHYRMPLLTAAPWVDVSKLTQMSSFFGFKVRAVLIHHGALL